MTRDDRWQSLLAFAQQRQCNWPRNPGNGSAAGWGIHLDDDAPHNRLLGPVFERGPVSGVILQHGRELFSFGTPDRADMTFSVTKTYLALLAGVAWDDGLIADLDAAIVDTLPGIGFDDSHNRQISWRQMLQFTSEWQGRCWGVPDQVDRYRVVSLQQHGIASPAVGRKGDERPLKPPGTYWEYNDVRINVFALALTHLFGASLPQIFRERITSRLGAGYRHQWYGYHNSWCSVGGRQLQSVPGGGHWGGGLRICAREQALVGQMMLDHGRFKGEQIISSEWIALMRTPCDRAPFYGFYTWLNRSSSSSAPLPVPAASADSFFAFGVGGQVIWHEPELAAVAVLRWIDSAAINEWIDRIRALLV